MKVKQLIKLLQKADPGAEVILATDMEGNSFDKVSRVEIDNIGFSRAMEEIKIADDLIVKRPGPIGISMLCLNKKALRLGWTKEDVNPKAKKCIILWP